MSDISIVQEAGMLPLACVLVIDTDQLNLFLVKTLSSVTYGLAFSLSNVNTRSSLCS